LISAMTFILETPMMFSLKGTIFLKGASSNVCCFNLATSFFFSRMILSKIVVIIKSPYSLFFYCTPLVVRAFLLLLRSQYFLWPWRHLLEWSVLLHWQEVQVQRLISPYQDVGLVFRLRRSAGCQHSLEHFHL